ncbi:MAG TPA: amidase [Mycobacteriales bacterium]
MTELHDLTALEQAAAIRTREISPVELTEHYLARIDRHSADLGAFVTVIPERALDQAKAAAAAVAAGDDLPPLHGVPTAIKDLNATAGVRTTLGSAAFADWVPDYDDNVVVRLREAGTISLGKTNTPEFGLPCYTEPDVAPPARTPWDTTRSAGGSSGGAGAAVAAGLVPFAQGSDGGGSVRIPSSVCGLFGIKPTRGRIGAGPRGNEVTGLSTAGPMARTVADAAAMLDAMAGMQPGDPQWAPALPPGETFLGHASQEPGRLRIGRFRDNLLGAPVDPACVTAWEEATALLTDLGHEVVEVPVPALGSLYDAFTVLWSGNAAAIPLAPAQEEQVRPLTRMLRERGAGFSAADFIRAVGSIQIAAREHLRRIWAYDAVLTPTLAQLPAPVGGLRDDEQPTHDFAAQGAFTPFTAMFNTTGQPAVNVPLHRTPEGLPVGVQLVGRSADEVTLIRLSAQLEAARPWKDAHPAVWTA